LYVATGIDLFTAIDVNKEKTRFNIVNLFIPSCELATLVSSFPVLCDVTISTAMSLVFG